MRAKIAGLLHEAARTVASKKTVPLKLVVENRHPFLCPRCGMGHTIDRTHYLDQLTEIHIPCDNCSKTLKFREPWDYDLEVPVTDN